MGFSISPAATFSTDSTHDYMFEISPEVKILPERPLHRREKVFIAIYSFTTLAAYQVMMMPFLGVVIDKLIADFALIHTTGLFHKSQRAGDG